MTRLRYWWCGLLRGHLPVTKSGNRTLREECYLCGAPLGEGGWDYRDLPTPRYRPGVLRVRFTVNLRQLEHQLADAMRRVGGAA